MAKINFFIRTITSNKNALVPIYVRLQSGKEIDIVCKTDILIKPDNWNSESQKARQRDYYNAKPMNEKILKLRTAIEIAIENIHQSDLISMVGTRDPLKLKSKDRNRELSLWLSTVIDKCWHPEKYEVTLYSFIEEFALKSATKPNSKTGKIVCSKVQKDYTNTLNDLKGFGEEQKKVFDFKDIDLSFFDDFIQYLQKKKLAVNTIRKKITVLKTFLNAAKEEGKNPYDAYKSKKFSVKGEESDSVYLNESELDKIYKLNLSKNDTVDRVRDLFLVGCWTGCRYSDIAQITPENISDGFINIKQIKTGQAVSIPLHPIMSAILKKYKGVLPEPIENGHFNKYVSDIAELAGINEKVHKAITKGGVNVSKAYKKFELCSSHTARRSFATNLYLSGFPTLSIMAITGHKTEESFMRYIKVTPREHGRKLQDHWTTLKAV